MAHLPATLTFQPAGPGGSMVDVPITLASQFTTIKHMIDDFDPAALAAPISLPNISTPIFERVLAYGYQQQRQQEEASAQAAKEWNKKFFQVDIIALCELLLAANCLDYKPLLDAASIAIGDLMRGKTPEEIRVEFNIKNDFTPEEEERIARENDWVE